jgi:hypothetical protein
MTGQQSSETKLPNYVSFACDGVFSDLNLTQDRTEFITLSSVHDCQEVNLSIATAEKLRDWLNKVLVR